MLDLLEFYFSEGRYGELYNNPPDYIKMTKTIESNVYTVFAEQQRYVVVLYTAGTLTRLQIMLVKREVNAQNKDTENALFLQLKIK